MSAVDPARLETWRRRETSLDARDMRAHVAALADQIEETLERTAGLPATLSARSGPPTAVAVAGMGGSAVAADLVAGYTAGHRRRPLVTIRGYRLPIWLDPHAFLLASSYSGNTEETLSAYRDAKSRGVPAVAVTTGGRLSELARDAGDPVVELPVGLPPRAALGHSLTAVARIVAELDPGLDPAAEADRLAGAAERLRPRLGRWLTWEVGNPALAIAVSLAERLPVVYGGHPVSIAAATRWRTQLNENAKLLAHSAAFPEHNHNEIEAFETDDPVLAQLALVYLETPWDDPRIAERFERVRRLCADRVAAQHRVRAQGEDELDGLLWLCGLGDCASFLASVIRGLDPTPVRSIDRLKAGRTEPTERGSR